MYDELVAKCRCGRPRSEGHLVKCLQRVKQDEHRFEQIKTSDGGKGAQRTDQEGSESTTNRFPVTTAGANYSVD